jgi:hypothetical protein
VRARTALALWAGLTLAGGLLVALPDDDRRVFSLSQGHGPAALDLAGMGLVLAALGFYAAGLVLGRRGLRARDAAVAAALYLPATALAAWSVATDAGAWWLLGVAGALGAQAWLARGAWRA